MTENEITAEAEIRRFLLGGMSEDERSAFEQQFVADDAFFDQVRVTEDELIESYVRETLSAAERKQFEQSFLTTERRRQRIAFTRTMLKNFTEQKQIVAAKKTETAAVAAPSVWDSIAGFFKTPSLAFGAALAILLAAFGGWFLLTNSNRNELARQNTPTPAATAEPTQPNSNQPTPTPTENRPANSNLKTTPVIETNANNSGQKRETPNVNANALPDTQREKPATVNPVLALFAGTVRSEGKTKELNLPKNAGNVLLQLNLESQDYKIYQAEIVSADGEVLAKSERLTPKKSKINFSVPAAKLARGDYIVKLSALNQKNENESVADYTFRVNRK